MKPIFLALAMAAAAMAAEHPTLSGTYLLESSLSKSDFDPVTKMIVSQTGNRFRMEQSDKDGMTAHSVQGECLVDGVRHAVPEADDEWITCRWNGRVVVTEQTWSGARQSRVTQTSLNADGKLVQDIRTTGTAGAKSAHLVWTKQVAATDSADTPVSVKAAMQTEAAEPVFPEPYATPSADNHQRIIPAPSAAVLHSLEGFEVSLWAKGFSAPRFMLQGKNGEILLADSGTSARTGTVYVFPGGDPARRKALIGSLDRPYGLALWKNYLYVGEADSIKRYPYDTAGFTLGKGEQVVSLRGMDQGHWTRSLLFDSAGEKLYVGIGSEENVGTGEDLRRAAINRYNPDGSGHEIYASGLRNPVGLHWNPVTGALWAAVQERDALGDDLVPDYFTPVRQGAFYGWPYTYLGMNQDPRMKAAPKALADKIAEPEQLLGAHVAVLDFTFYTGTQFPAEFQGGAFLAFHGSWNRSKRAGYVVSFLPFKDGQPSGKAYDFVAGWTDTGDETAVYGRPVAVFQTTDGSLLISDDGGGVIWKVGFRGEKPSR
ncbi:MAG: PQQ-dependent sugar dehydrogenase [Acidobacteriota bacterium]|nr:PQQ-dependent sugar dehydrogenase [Acidobacteriota bacterium]